MIDFGELSGRHSFFLMRHGESTGNEYRVAQGKVDLPLTERGREQAARAARWFEDQDISVILASPLARATETAEIIAAHLRMERIEIHEELLEIDAGIFSGMRWDEIEGRYPREQRDFFRHWWDGVPGAESSDRLYERGEAAWRLLLDTSQLGKPRILTITHSGLLQWIIKATMNNRSWFPILPMDNCSVYKLVVDNRIVPPSPQVQEATPFHRWRWELMGYRIGD